MITILNNTDILEKHRKESSISVDYFRDGVRSSIENSRLVILYRDNKVEIFKNNMGYVGFVDDKTYPDLKVSIEEIFNMVGVI